MHAREKRLHIAQVIGPIKGREGEGKWQSCCPGTRSAPSWRTPSGNEAFGIDQMHPGKFAIFVGGFPVVHDGEVVGAVGVSGGNGDQDKAVGAAALRAFREKVATAWPPSDA
ncbi:heme-binding protein [Actinomadura sp. 3N407]|uniref:heme-binding protein n=1 Tax=Actinomadura sp. 3N407 TaxID=3457423 RepID=UPI003FCD9F38